MVPTHVLPCQSFSTCQLHSLHFLSKPIDAAKLVVSFCLDSSTCIQKAEATGNIIHLNVPFETMGNNCESKDIGLKRSKIPISQWGFVSNGLNIRPWWVFVFHLLIS